MPVSAHTYTPVYNGDTFVPDFKHMDLAEVEAHRRQAQEDIYRHQASLAAQDREKKKLQREADLKELREKLEKEKHLTQHLPGPKGPENAE